MFVLRKYYTLLISLFSYRWKVFIVYCATYTHYVYVTDAFRSTCSLQSLSSGGTTPHILRDLGLQPNFSFLPCLFLMLFLSHTLVKTHTVSNWPVTDATLLLCASLKLVWISKLVDFVGCV